MYNKYFSRSFILVFLLLFVRLLIHEGLENIDGYMFSRGTEILVHIVLKTYTVNVLLII